MVYVSADHQCAALGFTRDVWNKFTMVAGLPDAMTTRIVGPYGHHTHRGYELEATLLWLAERVPSFSEKHEAKLRGMAQESAR